MNRLHAFVGVLCVAGCLQAAAAEMFKWVDKDGTVHYGDRPPDTGGGVQEVNASLLPPALQERLRSLDPAFVITKFGGNLNVGLVCGEFDPDSAGAREPHFPALVESAGLGTVKPDAVAQGQGAYVVQYDGQYDAAGTYRRYPHMVTQPGKCAWPAQRDASMQRRAYDIRFNADTVRAYRTDSGH